jgi:hypothetical protein
MYLPRRQLAAGQPGKADGVWLSGRMRTQEATSKALARHKQRALFHLLQAPGLHAPLPAHREETTHDPPRRRGKIRPVTPPARNPRRRQLLQVSALTTAIPHVQIVSATKHRSSETISFAQPRKGAGSNKRHCFSWCADKTTNTTPIFIALLVSSPLLKK